MSYKSKEVLNVLAKTAADSYIKNKASLNESLKKVAAAEGLEPHQVEYIAGEANKMVWAHNYKLDKKAAYDFPIADPKSIVDSAQKKPVEKVAEVDMDYMLPPVEHTKVASEGQVYGSFQVKENENIDRRELKHTLQNRYEKLAQAKESAAMDMIVIQGGIENLEKKFIKEARTLIIETPFMDRPQAMEKIAEFVRSTGHIEKGRDLMKKLANKIVKDGLVKQADMKAPEEYISKNLPARIINGNHSLYITIDTIVKQEQNLANLRQNFIIADDTLPVLKEKIREL